MIRRIRSCSDLTANSTKGQDEISNKRALITKKTAITESAPWPIVTESTTYDEFYCPICLDIMSRPTRLSCNHTFCRSCLKQAAKNNNSCPICRSNPKSCQEKAVLGAYLQDQFHGDGSVNHGEYAALFDAFLNIDEKQKALDYRRNYQSWRCQNPTGSHGEFSDIFPNSFDRSANSSSPILNSLRSDVNYKENAYNSNSLQKVDDVLDNYDFDDINALLDEDSQTLLSDDFASIDHFFTDFDLSKSSAAAPYDNSHFGDDTVMTPTASLPMYQRTTQLTGQRTQNISLLEHPTTACTIPYQSLAPNVASTTNRYTSAMLASSPETLVHTMQFPQFPPYMNHQVSSPMPTTHMFNTRNREYYGHNGASGVGTSASGVHWEKLCCTGNPPAPRYDHSTVTYRGNIFVVGGVVGEERLCDLHILHIGSKHHHWSRPRVKGNPPPSGFLPRTFLIGSKMYVLGGTNDGKRLTQLHVIDLDREYQWQQVYYSGVPPSMRYWYTINVIDLRVYIFGGYSGNCRLNDVHVLNFETIPPSWSALNVAGTIPGPRSTHSCVVHEKKLYVFGGYDGKSRIGHAHILDTGKPTPTWITPKISGKSPRGRYNHSAVVRDSKMIIFGGNTGSLRNDIYVLDLETLSWINPTVKGNLPLPRSWHRAEMLGRDMYVIAGHTECKLENDVWKLHVDNVFHSLSSPTPANRPKKSRRI